MHPGPGSPCRIGRAVLTGVVALAAALVGAAPASAHTHLEYTVPADQEQVAEPVTQITVAFGAPVTLVGAGFEVFTPQEVIVQPNVFTEDDMVFLLQLDEPLAGGEAGVRYEVTATDGHVLAGGFRFTVPTSAPASAPASEPVSEPVAGTTAGLAVDTAAPAVIAPVPTATPTPTPTPTPTSTLDDAAADGAGGSSTGVIVGVVAALALVAVAFVVLRSRGARAT